jgi:hypothetical protein
MELRVAADIASLQVSTVNGQLRPFPQHFASLLRIVRDGICTWRSFGVALSSSPAEKDKLTPFFGSGKRGNNRSWRRQLQLRNI